MNEDDLFKIAATLTAGLVPRMSPAEGRSVEDVAQAQGRAAHRAVELYMRVLGGLGQVPARGLLIGCRCRRTRRRVGLPLASVASSHPPQQSARPTAGRTR
jgi:hypothetical protein